MKPRPAFYSSPLSRFVAEHIAASDFHYLDGDEVLYRHSALPVAYARETGTLRILEAKHPGEQLRRSQRETLPIIAGALLLAARARLITPTSGVYIVEGRPPYTEGAVVTRIRPATAPLDWSAIGVQTEATRALELAQLETFLRCRAVA